MLWVEVISFYVCFVKYRLAHSHAEMMQRFSDGYEKVKVAQPTEEMSRYWEAWVSLSFISISWALCLHRHKSQVNRYRGRDRFLSFLFSLSFSIFSCISSSTFVIIQCNDEVRLQRVKGVRREEKRRGEMRVDKRRHEEASHLYEWSKCPSSCKSHRARRKEGKNRWDGRAVK